jgi:hypothetical protein
MGGEALHWLDQLGGMETKRPYQLLNSDSGLDWTAQLAFLWRVVNFGGLCRHPTMSSAFVCRGAGYVFSQEVFCGQTFCGAPNFPGRFAPLPDPCMGRLSRDMLLCQEG